MPEADFTVAAIFVVQIFDILGSSKLHTPGSETIKCHYL